MWTELTAVLQTRAPGRKACLLMIEFQANPFAPNQMRLPTRIWLPSPVSDLFAFFADAANLESITPPWLRFRISRPRPIEMSAGTLIDDRLRLHFVPIRWQSENSVWEPPLRFVDRQLRGPYRMWEHTHTFKPANGGTLVRDDIDYAAPGGPVVERFLVRPDLRRIFEYRHQRLHEFFGDSPEPTAIQPMREPLKTGREPCTGPPQ